MCGIAGIYNIRGSCPVDLEKLSRMASLLEHRGPDEFGIYIDNNVGLASSRLKIIDLLGGTQPIHNEDQTLWIVFNGEIFNYIELRKDLQKKHHFYTSTDTEVILHLFEEKGFDCLQELNGEFAFAVYDSNKQELFLARDRFGIRPLYYTFSNGKLIFASEIKSIFSDKDIKREIDPIALDQIFTFWTTIPGRSSFKNISELPAAHYLRISSEYSTVRCYWNIPFTPVREHYLKGFDDFSKNLYDLLKDAVRIRLRSDVPVGCYISGGLDSSGIAALLKNHYNHHVETFGIGFEEKSYDESEFQDNIVSYLNVPFSRITISNKDIGELLPFTILHTEKPVLRTAPVPMFALAKFVHNSGFRVVLTGEGADEVFGGYDLFKETKVRSFWAKRPDSELRPLLLKRIYPYISEDKKLQHFMLQFYKNGINNPEHIFFSHLLRWENTSRLKAFFSERIASALKDYNCYEDLKKYIPESFSSWDYLSKAQYLEIILFLNNYLLSSQGDRMAMAFSVETRLPYLDYRIIEFLSKVPASWKIHGLQEKYILKKAMQDILPYKIVHRTKYPYRAPIKPGLFSNNGNGFREALSKDFYSNSEIFDIKRVNRLIDKLTISGRASEQENMALAGILSTQYLYEGFIENGHCSNQNITLKLIYDKRGDVSHERTEINSRVFDAIG